MHHKCINNLNSLKSTKPNTEIICIMSAPDPECTYMYTIGTIQWCTAMCGAGGADSTCYRHLAGSAS